MSNRGRLMVALALEKNKELSPVTQANVPEIESDNDMENNGQSSLLVVREKECKTGQFSFERNRALNYTSDADDSVDDPTYTPDEIESDSSIDTAKVRNRSVPSFENIGSQQSRHAVTNILQSEASTSKINTSLNTATVLNAADETRKGKKRMRNENSWVKNKKKVLVNTGQAYETLSGKQVPAKFIKQACGVKCRLKCSEKISEEERATLFTSFYKLADKTRHRDFLSKCMQVTTPRKYRKECNRALNYAYYFSVNSTKIRVCKLFLRNTLCISNTALSTVNKKTKDDFLEEDLRGRHKNHKSLPKNMKDYVREHINSFPKIPSHYCRADTNKQYLEGSLNIATMHRLYTESCLKNNIPQCKYSMYEQIFNTEFNLSFHTPKKDQCAKCEQFNNSSAEEKEVLQDSYDTHIIEKNAAREQKVQDIARSNENPKVLVFVYDLQAVIQLPCGEVSSFYYKSKLNFINFTVCNARTKDGNCFTWHEGTAKRGANEIGTCVYNFLKVLTENHGELNEVIFYSDNCVGQNKNKMILSMYMYAIETLPIKVITHKFLISGHTQNEADAMHSLIEREKKRIMKSGPLYIPAQLTTIIKAAKKSGVLFSVKEMETEDFLNWREISDTKTKYLTANEQGEKFQWADIKVFQIRKEISFKIFYKTSFLQEEFKIVNIKRSSRGKQATTQPQTLYKSSPGISKQKKSDLLSLCKNNLIPKSYHSFFESLNTTVDDTNEN